MDGEVSLTRAAVPIRATELPQPRAEEAAGSGVSGTAWHWVLLEALVLAAAGSAALHGEDTCAAWSRGEAPDKTEPSKTEVSRKRRVLSHAP